MRLLISIAIFSMALAQVDTTLVDTKKKRKKSRLNLNVGGLIPEKMHGDERANSLAPSQIEEIQRKIEGILNPAV